MSKTSWQSNGVHTNYFDAKGLRGWNKSLSKLGAGYSNFSPAWPKVAQLMATSVKKEFASEGRYEGDAWKKPTAEYQDYKRKVGMHSEMGKFYGEIYDHFTDPRRASLRSGPMAFSFGGGSAQGLEHARAVNFGMKGEGFRAKKHTRRAGTDKIRWAGQGKKNKRPQRKMKFLGWTKPLYWDVYKQIGIQAGKLVKQAGLKTSLKGKRGLK
jgi:hypothetical protein